MNDRRSSALGIALTVFACAWLVGCAPDPEPTPTPQATFASEAEAFAAAEAVYRAYIDASNSGEDTLQYLAGSLYEEELDSLRSLDVRNLRSVGDTKIVTFEGIELEQHGVTLTITAQTCIDISDSRLLDDAGTDVTPTQRNDAWVLKVTFNGSPSQLLATTAKALSSGASC